MDYEVYVPGKNMCVPSCLQSVLDRRNLDVPCQKDIARELGMASNEPLFFREDLEPLRGFLQARDLGLKFFNPFFDMFIDSYDFLKEHFSERVSKEVDMMVGFDPVALYRSDNLILNHFALVSYFEREFDRVVLHDNQEGISKVSLFELNRSIAPNSSSDNPFAKDGKGFYVIS
jgi:hypothetical protein